MEAWKVRLRQPNNRTVGSGGELVQQMQVSFDVSPDISESGSVAYKTIDPVHSPGGIMVFSNTNARTFQISNIKLVSRTREEATINYHRLHILKSWRYPVFGKADLDPYYGGALLGKPPSVLEFSAYARPNGDNQSGMATGLIHRVPVVITQLGIDYPSDVDYIPTAAGDSSEFGTMEYAHIPADIPMPIILPINITLSESQSPQRLSRFSLSDFRKGRLDGF